MLLIVIASTLLQFAAGFLALRLIAVSGRNRAWFLLAAGIFAMAFRRLHTLITLYRTDAQPPLNYELLGLGISILIFAGIQRIGPLLREMRRSAEDLAESEERYRTVALFTHDWEYWLTPDGRYEYVSPACERISGYPPEAFRHDPRLFHNLIHPEDRETVLNRFASLDNLQHPLDFDCRIRNARGETRWIAYHSVPVRDANGLFRGVRASIRDIDRRRALEQELTVSRALYRGLVENCGALVVRLEGTGVITFANRYAADRLGDGEALAGRRLADVLAEQGGGEGSPEAALGELLRNGNRQEWKSELRHADGTVTWIRWSGSAVADAEGAVTEYICTGFDTGLPTIPAVSGWKGPGSPEAG